MATVQQILDQALYETHLKAAQINSTQLLGWFNLIRKELSRTIMSDVSENFFFEIWTRDIVANRPDGEYPFPIASTSIKGLAKLVSVNVKTSATATDFTKAKEVDISALPQDWSYYLREQSPDEPIYFVADNSLFLAPQFTADQLSSPTENDLLKLYGIAKVEDLLATDDATKILIPDEYQFLIAQGMQYHIYKSRGKVSEANAVQVNYINGKFDMVDKLTNRDISAFSASIPDDTALQY